MIWPGCTGTPRILRLCGGGKSAPARLDICAARFTILPAGQALRMASLIIGPLDWAGFGRAWHSRHGAGLAHPAGLSPEHAPREVTGASRLPALREHAGDAARCIPTTGRKPHVRNRTSEGNQRVGWTRETQ